MKEKEMRRRPNQTEKTRRKIVEAIHVSMKEADLSDITIRSVCKKAGVSIGTFYLYFSCKAIVRRMNSFLHYSWRRMHGAAFVKS